MYIHKDCLLLVMQTQILFYFYLRMYNIQRSLIFVFRKFHLYRFTIYSFCRCFVSCLVEVDAINGLIYDFSLFCIFLYFEQAVAQIYLSSGFEEQIIILYFLLKILPIQCKTYIRSSISHFMNYIVYLVLLIHFIQ